MALRISYGIGGLAAGIGLVLGAGTALAQPTRGTTGGSFGPPGTPHTLQDALGAAYSYNPSLQSERATLRATDEGVPQALAGWRPTVVLGANAGYACGNITELSTFAGHETLPNERITATGTATVTQPLYRGGRTRATTNQAKNTDYAGRATLIATEEQVLSDTVNAYVGVIEAAQLLQLNISNEQVLRQQLRAANDRFRVGEITRTDVAQAEAALAGAIAQRETAEGNLQIANATYLRQVGFAPTNLTNPQPLRATVRNEVEAGKVAASNNPNVIAALFNLAAAKDAISVAWSALMPTVSLQGQAFREDNVQTSHTRFTGETVTAVLSVPLYQGGSEYSAVRQARQTEQARRKTLDDTRRLAVEQAVSAWETLVADRATIASTRAQITANEVALEGVEREALVGSRTTLDVLNAEQLLLTSRVTLVQNLASLVTASYTLASATGRLTARDLALHVPLYDDTAYFRAVRDRLWGTGDYATDQPGR
ncbi:MAG TPA: TolC family outer membrane protein [Acetobacteraceae bacterium]|nr:TolC family outer membrane protein [Acetobacteraceae bacterium]